METPMDINDLRVFFTLATMACFIGIAFWAYSRRNRDRFDEAAMLPFSHEDQPETTQEQP